MRHVFPFHKSSIFKYIPKFISFLKWLFILFEDSIQKLYSGSIVLGMGILTAIYWLLPVIVFDDHPRLFLIYSQIVFVID